MENNRIFDEIDKILKQDINMDYNCISLYNVFVLIKDKYDEYNNLINHYRKTIGHMLYNDFVNVYVNIDDFDYENECLKIDLYIYKKHYNVIFSKKDNDLYIVSSQIKEKDKIMILIGNKVSELYDKFMKLKDYREQYSSNIRFSNSIFKTNIYPWCIEIFVTSEFNRLRNIFSMSLFASDKIVKYEGCNSLNLLNYLKNNEDEILKRMFVDIKYCPDWSRDTLAKIREEQINDEKKKQKRLSIIKRIIPWKK